MCHYNEVIELMALTARTLWMEGPGVTSSGKRRRSESEGKEETEVNNVHIEEHTSEQATNGHRDADELEDKAPAPHSATAEGGGADDSEEEMLVVLELSDFKNHPLFDDYSSATLEGIDTVTPMLKIGEYELHGQLEETVGTSYFYDTDTSKMPDKTYQFAGQTIKKIKFTIAPPEDV
ncbi:hypothetical protein F442_12232 [Phytophthora nicotianae P10297]|uniref:Transcription factor TFIIIC triple barrel domain-containing protein n=1 Tax=Phytophthora nicotianae P10297 TaxID=1317064 RepID=W2Z0C3_PHYNI|nr:hypothetical protein F442_12232 [Phytophthora nicotianae P10297]